MAGDSMQPVLREGRIVIASGRFRRLWAGDVVIIGHGGLEKVKRLQRISDDRIFVVGDNQEHSTDSRSFGWLSIAEVRGKVIWPRRLRRAD